MQTINTPVKRQIKFAVVMYGGGSLAIYINGVAQELLKLAQATNSAQTTWDGTTRIYRKVALLLSGWKGHFDSINSLELELANPQLPEKDRLKKQDERKLLKAELEAAIPNVEFIIDVLTGSSAGGINAVFLSKALINGAPNMDDLQKLWLEQGDFAKLLNDRQSVADNSLNAPQQPESLLNSQRMYLELLKALEGLDASSNPATACIKPPSLLDLYVTYTDFDGLPTNLVLSDKTVKERVHKRVFNFRHATGKNDFGRDNNPFLAFAARCTSSFPFAFEPMRLTNIDDIIENDFARHEGRDSKCPDWKQYFGELIDDNGKPVKWENRWFVDGGCLDNKPFGYAIDRLSQTTGEGIIERKLLYIEPNPEAFRDQKNLNPKPNALENVLGQAAGLPSYETIREDLQRVLDRNRLIERIARLTADVESDFDKNPTLLTPKKKEEANSLKAKQKADPDFWSKVDLAAVAEIKGPAFIPYYRLRVSSTTDEIARLVTRYFKIEENSDYFNAIRAIIRAWRESQYTEYPDKGSKKQTFNQFLYQYDLEYRLRRLRFVLQKTEYLLRHANDIKGDLEKVVAEQIARPRKAKNTKDVKVADTKTQDQEAHERVVVAQEGVVSSDTALSLAIPAADGAGGTASIAAKAAFVESFNAERLVQATIEMQSALGQTYTRLRRDTELLKEKLGSHDLEGQGTTAEDKALLANLAVFQRDLGAIYEVLKALDDQQPKLDDLDKSEVPAWLTPLYRILRSLSLQSDRGFAGAAKFDAIEALRVAFPKVGAVADKDSLSKEDAKQIDKKNRDFPEWLWPLRNALVNAGKSLDRDIFNKTGAFLRQASSEAKSLLRIRDNKGNPPPEVPTDKFENSFPEAKFVQNYLRNYYQLFDSYDQISYPLFFESCVGEAVKVDVVRISSRDAHDLINEEDPKEKRRKLAGDYLFAFGAFLDPRWRLNDIMWGRLDGTEHLITTLLPGSKFEAERDELIEEANKIILSELLLKNAQGDFQANMVTALTLAATEAQQRDAVDKLVVDLTRPAIENGLTTALTSTLTENNLYEGMKKSYQVNRRLEPEPTLKMISRSTQIIGKILEKITEDQVQMGSRVAWIAKLGQIFWGLITVATTNSIWNSLFNYWIQLFYVFEVVVIVGATVFAKSQIQQFGIIALIMTLGIHLSVMSLQEVMDGEKFWKSFVRTLIIGVGGIFVIVGILFFYITFFEPQAKEVWGGIESFRSFISQPEFARWNRLLPLAPFAFLTVILGLWRQAQKLNLVIIGRAIMLGVAAALAVGAFINAQIHGQCGPTPAMIRLEFVENAAELAKFQVTTCVAGMQDALWVDTLVFIPLYVGFLLILAAVLYRRRQRAASIAAIVAGVCTAVAGVADLAENRFSFAGLDSSAIDLDRIAHQIRMAAEIKWTLAFIALAILATIFLRLKDGLLWNVPAVLMALGAIAGIVGTYAFQPGVTGPSLITSALGFEFLTLFLVAITFLFAPMRRNFLRGY